MERFPNRICLVRTPANEYWGHRHNIVTTDRNSARQWVVREAFTQLSETGTAEFVFEILPQAPVLEVVSIGDFRGYPPDATGLIRGIRTGKYYTSRHDATPNRSEGRVWTPLENDVESWEGMNVEVEVLSRGTKEGGVSKKCKIDQVLSANVMALLKSNPTHPTFRAQVLAEILQPLPDDKVNFKDIQEWIESTIDPKELRRSRTETTSPPGSGIEVVVESSEEVSGTCRYSGTDYGQDHYSLTVEEIVDAADGCESMYEVMNKITELLQEKVDDNPPGMGPGEDGYDYNSEEQTSSNGREDNWNNHWLTREVIDRLRRHNRDHPALE